MGRIEFPSTPINASAQSRASSVEQNGYAQLPLEGIEMEQTPELELGNCTVTSSVRFRKLVRGNEWHCNIHVAPDLLHPEQEGDFVAHAFNSYADLANKEHLRPGDRALLRGTLQQQIVELENGATTSINHFYVTSLEVLSRSKRTSMTVFEKAKEEKRK